MAESKTTSQAQQIPGAEQWKKLVDEQGARVGQLFDEAGKAQAKWIDFGNTQIDELAELMKTQFNAMNELAAEWRKLSLESAKKAMEVLSR